MIPGFSPIYALIALAAFGGGLWEIAANHDMTAGAAAIAFAALLAIPATIGLMAKRK
jgi:hypothetical protein